MTQRPKEFDDRLKAYLPGLRALAATLVPRPYREDLVVDTVMFALEKWQNLRDDGGMWGWLVWNMRGIVSNQAQKAASRARNATFLPIEDHMNLAVPASQEAYTTLSETLREISSNRNGDVLLRRAMGDGLKEIADERGITCERVRQIEVAARSALRVAA